MNIDYKARTVEIDGVVLKEGDYISLNGSTGVVYNGKVETKAAELSGDFAELMTLADKYTRLQVRTNADTPHDAEVARNFGAVGIGLCRTEHMFFEGEKIKAMREMILAEDAEGRRKALAKILPYQQADFKGIFKAMAGCPVTVRLLDPPLHEFVPHDLKGQQEMADTMGVSLQYIQQRVESLCEHNPMRSFFDGSCGLAQIQMYKNIITMGSITYMLSCRCQSAACSANPSTVMSTRLMSNPSPARFRFQRFGSDISQ